MSSSSFSCLWRGGQADDRYLPSCYGGSGWNWTAARNLPGSLSMFGGSAFVKEYLFKLDRYK